VPIGRLDPYFALYGGYAFTGALSTGLADQATVHGFDAGLSVGGDYYFASLLSFGIDVSGGALFLQRPPVALPAGFDILPPAAQQMIKDNPLYANSGNSAGLQVAGSLHLALHLGL
jgi:hypothetical protein